SLVMRTAGSPTNRSRIEVGNALREKDGTSRADSSTNAALVVNGPRHLSVVTKSEGRGIKNIEGPSVGEVRRASRVGRPRAGCRARRVDRLEGSCGGGRRVGG